VPARSLNRFVSWRAYSFDEAMDLGEDTGTAVFPGYTDKIPFACTRKLDKVTIELIAA
jgi:hypothetical protein